MPDTVALLRGMNVGGHRLTNEQLVEIIKDLGLTEVAAYQASGNVLFSSDSATSDALEDVVEAGLADALGYEVPTMVRTAAEIRAVLATEPFSILSDRPAGKPQIAFLKAAPSPTEVGEIEALAPSTDRLVAIGRELYWWPDGGVSDTLIDWVAVNRRYGPLTIRTRGTIERIAKKLTT